MHLSAIHIYPVKSCRGISLESAELDALGLAGDRRFMIVEAAGPTAGKYKFLTQRTHPRMALIAPALSAGTLTLSAPGLGALRVPRIEKANTRPPRPAIVEIWKDQNLAAEDCGDEASAWLTAFLETPARLVRIGEKFHRPVKPAKARPGDLVAFADGYPLLAIAEASLAELNTRLVARGEPPVPMDRFRPNLVFAGCPAHAEDNAPRLSIGKHNRRSATITLRAAGPCARCIITTTDQQTAARTGPEPLRTLATYRRDPAKTTDVNFGQNFIHETKTGTLRVGDSIELLP